MRTLRRYLLSALALLLTAGALPACSLDTSTGFDEDAGFVFASPTPTTGTDAATVTPAPSGFVPGDALPTIVPNATPTQTAITTIDGQEYRELTWEELVPPGYRPEDIMAKYQEELSAFQDGDPAAWDLYEQMQEEFNNAPVNSQLNQSNIKLPGFIAPLEYEGELVTEFLLVPYFGACIHVPPPPVNQTVHVTLAEGEGISAEEAFYPVWVHGYMITDGISTDIGEAGYRIEGAMLTSYEYPTG